MITALINTVSSLRDFFTRQFFLASFLPTVIFVLVNVTILFVWSWRFYDYIQFLLYQATAIHKAVVVTLSFFTLWVWSYLTAALTQHWTRTLEGKTWANPESIRKVREINRTALTVAWSSLKTKQWKAFFKQVWNLAREIWQKVIRWKAGLVVEGIKFHSARFDSLTKQLESAVRIYATIESERATWRTALEQSFRDAQRPANEARETKDLPVETQKLIDDLESAKRNGTSITSQQVQEIYTTLAAEIPQLANHNAAREIAERITLLTDYAFLAARREHTRLFNERNLEFGERPEVLPTRFGNVGLSAQAFAMRAYNCNLLLVWSILKRVAASEQKSSDPNAPESVDKIITDAKALLDFFVACFWFSLALAVGWAIIFAWHGEWPGTLGAALAGPFICWTLWYGAAVEQYRVLQSHIISSLNGPLRFKILEELRLRLPSDLVAERELWNDFDLAIGHGLPRNISYNHPNRP